MKPQTQTAPAKLSVEQFVHNAIRSLRDEKKGYKGIHTVYSGFNEAFRAYFGGEKNAPIEATKALVAAGKLQSHGARGGAMIYLPGEMPEQKNAKGEEALAKILGK